MANSLSEYPLKIDTVTDVSMVSKPFNAVVVRWTSASLADTVVLKDKDGNVRWQSVGQNASNVEESNFSPDHPLTFNGLSVTTLDAGTVYIYTKEKDPV